MKPAAARKDTIAIWVPDRKVTIRNEDLHHAVDYTPYEGRQVMGWPQIVLSRGEIVVEDGKLLAVPGRGQFLPCDAPALGDL
jgi:dihydropyrimidinase